MRMPRLSLLTPRDNAAVVIGERHYGLPQSGRVEDPLAGAVEVIAVDEGEAGHVRDDGLTCPLIQDVLKM